VGRDPGIRDPGIAIPSAGEPERIPKIFQNISELFWMFCFSFVSHLQANEQNETGVFLFY